METFDERKFREMVVYIAERSRSDVCFSMTKLHAILFYSDFAAYRQLGRSISGAEYRHLSVGSAASELPATSDGLIAEGAISVVRVSAGRYVEKRANPQRRADLSVFTDDELAIIDKAIGDLWRLSAKQAGALSRQEPGWRLTRSGEVIPYRTAWLSAAPLTDEQIVAGKEIAERHGLLESPTI
ncbi:MAG: type II toxin-antitoxin system antitoxin SocA domain-containing protein [Dehalococcoidia bacterium]